MALYYRKHMKKYSRIAAPLITLTKQDKDYRWDDACDRAFRDIKVLLSSEPVLTLPNQSDPFILAVDFSYDDMGLIFFQIQQGQERVIGYYSKTLSPAEKKYGAIEGECAIMVWTLQKVTSFVIGSRFYVYIDHKALTWLLQTKNQNAKLSRWASLISQYDFAILYKAGSKHTNADFMSRSEPMQPGAALMDTEEAEEKLI